jgi:endoglucanase
VRVPPIELREIVREVVSIPTAPYLEGGVRDHLRAFAEERGLAHEEDRFGNAYVTYRRGRRRRPLVLGAHMDHPALVVTGVRGRRLDLEFRGGLAATYGKGEPLVLHREGAREPHARARVTSVRRDERGRLAGAAATLEPGAAGVEAGDLALWDVPACRFRGEIVQARACDDLAGAAAVLATLHRVAAERPNGHLVGLFTRAEEVGLLGASVAARERLLPEDALVVAVETSSLAGGRAEQGGGPIIRIGDAAHVFSPRMTQWMTALSTELAAEDASFRFQRKLMDGGVTEATSYDLYGYETGAACIALGNYHNAGPRGRVRAETVHLGDLEGLVRLFVRMHETVPRYERYLPALLRRYDGLGRAARTRLRGSARRG